MAMRTSGHSDEAWMSLIPLSVLLFVAMVAFGGPEAFANTVVAFANDAVASISSWLRHL